MYFPLSSFIGYGIPSYPKPSQCYSLFFPSLPSLTYNMCHQLTENQTRSAPVFLADEDMASVCSQEGLIIYNLYGTEEHRVQVHINSHLLQTTLV